MDASDFLRMFAYDHWANAECLRALRASQSPPSALGRLAHILSAEKLWLERMQEQKQSMPVWPASSVEECAALIATMAAAWRSFLSSLGPGRLNEVVAYRNSKGEAWTNRVEDILTHVLMHSTYHRGQIALEIRAAGYEPAYTDFIHAVRQNSVE